MRLLLIILLSLTSGVVLASPPVPIANAILSLTGENSAALMKYWDFIVIMFQISGALVVGNSMRNIYKRYRYNDHRLGEGQILGIITGVFMVKIEGFLEIVLTMIM